MLVDVYGMMFREGERVIIQSNINERSELMLRDLRPEKERISIS